jgi:hypothetical protein
MKIEQIIYDTTREVMNVEDKLRIATVFLFCQQLGNEALSDLLYDDEPASLIYNLNDQFKAYGIDLSINFANPNVLNAFELTRKKIIEKWDSDGFLKAIFDRDPFAIAICEIIEFDYDAAKPKRIAEAIVQQLTLFK